MTSRGSFQSQQLCDSLIPLIFKLFLAKSVMPLSQTKHKNPVYGIKNSSAFSNFPSFFSITFIISIISIIEEFFFHLFPSPFFSLFSVLIFNIVINSLLFSSPNCFLILISHSPLYLHCSKDFSESYPTVLSFGLSFFCCPKFTS